MREVSNDSIRLRASAYNVDGSMRVACFFGFAEKLSAAETFPEF